MAKDKDFKQLKDYILGMDEKNPNKS